MSLSTLYGQIAQIEKDIADLQKKMAEESKREFDKQKQVDSTSRSITKSISASTLESKTRQIRGYQSDIINIQGKKAELQKKIAGKSIELNRKKQELLKLENSEKQKEQKAQIAFQKKQRQEQAELQRRLQADLEMQRTTLSEAISNTYTLNNQSDGPLATSVKHYDFFISHATEDKESFVRPLANALTENGFNVWYDEQQLKVGDSLRKNIDIGLKQSKYGIVVLSSDFFRKNWPEYELNGLVAREMNGVKVILPIWHKVTKDEVLSYSPTLADKVALNTSTYSIHDIVMELKKLFD